MRSEQKNGAAQMTLGVSCGGPLKRPEMYAQGLTICLNSWAVPPR